MKTTLFLSRAVALGMSIQLALSPLAVAGVDSVLNQSANTVSAGQTAGNKPPVKDICDSLLNARDGKFVNEKNEPMKVLDPTCASKYTFRSDQKKHCMTPLTQVVKGMNGDVDQVCSGKTTGTLATYCALRLIAKNSQAIEYCKAYESADKASKGISRTLYFDVAAAGACWADYIAIKLSQNASVPYKGYVCGGAAMAASLAELVQTASILKKEGNRFDDERVNRKSGGAYKIDDANNVVKRGGLMKALEITASTTLSASAFMMGICYYNKKTSNGMCDKFRSIASNAAGNQKTQNAVRKFEELSGGTSEVYCPSVGAEVDFLGADGKTHKWKCTGKGKFLMAKNLSDASKGKEIEKVAKEANDSYGQAAQANLALQTALIFTALSGSRAIAKATAEKTKKNVQNLLHSMFDNSSGGAAMGGAVGGSAVTGYVGTGDNGFTSSSNNGTTQTAMTAGPGPDEAFLAPPGSGLEKKTMEVASKIPPSAVEKAGSSASDFAGAISGAAQAAGASNPGMLADIRNQSQSIFANLPKDEGGYGGGGGGGSSSGGKDSSTDINLKGLFGQNGEGEEKVLGESEEVAFRGPASEDIWHSQNPKGNNLFQIVSDKYDTVQRRSSIGAGI